MFQHQQRPKKIYVQGFANIFSVEISRRAFGVEGTGSGECVLEVVIGEMVLDFGCGAGETRFVCMHIF